MLRSSGEESRSLRDGTQTLPSANSTWLTKPVMPSIATGRSGMGKLQRGVRFQTSALPGLNHRVGASAGSIQSRYARTRHGAGQIFVAFFILHDPADFHVADGLLLIQILHFDPGRAHFVALDIGLPLHGQHRGIGHSQKREVSSIRRRRIGGKVGSR